MKPLSALEQIGLMAAGWNDAADLMAPFQVRTMNQAVNELVAGWRTSGLDPETMALPVLYGMAQACALVSVVEAEAESNPLLEMFRSLQAETIAPSTSASVLVALACNRYLEGTLL